MMADIVPEMEFGHFKGYTMALKYFQTLSEGESLSLKLKSEDLFDTGHGNALFLEDLKKIAQVKNLSVLDFQLPKHLDPILDDIAHYLAKIVLRKKCDKVIVSDFHVVRLRGKVEGILLQDVCKVVGDCISIETADESLRTREIISFSKFTSKIVHLSVSPENEDIIKKLNVLSKSKCTSIPNALTVAVVGAYKSIRKRRLTLDMIESLSGEVSKANSLQNTDKVKIPIVDTTTKSCKTKDSSGDSNTSQSSTSSSSTKDSQTECSKQKTGESPENRNTLNRNRKGKVCYVCKNKFNYPKKIEKFVAFWRQYPRMCKTCAEINFAKRHQRVDLSGKYAVVTGGRIKIGYELVLKLLRDGCFVIVTTRFPHNATQSFAAENDFDDWKDRLKVYGLDLKDIAGIYKFVKFVKATVPHLDILINNAAQTLRRPMDFYRHLLDYECIPHDHLPDEQQPLLASTEILNYNYYQQVQQNAVPNTEADQKPMVKDVTEEINEENDHSEAMQAGSSGSASREQNLELTSAGNQQKPKVQFPKVSFESNEGEPPTKKVKLAPPPQDKGSKIIFLQRSFSMDCTPASNTASNKEVVTDFHFTPAQGSSRQQLVQQGSNKNSSLFSMSQYFPRGAMDDDGQQLDLRRTNSWRTVLDHVPVPELMELMVVNVIAPFILNRDLKGKLMKSPSQRKFIVNVSAMEGQFNRVGKTRFHPHTNMAKAALNMMTRTAALGYEKQGIYMTSVDTGWVTDERPLYMATREKKKKGFRLPLDCVDGAARIYDPVVTGLSKQEKPHYAVFLKDYKPYPW